MNLKSFSIFVFHLIFAIFPGTIPSKQEICKQLPPNLELLNDWIFCHNHDKEESSGVCTDKGHQNTRLRDYDNARENIDSSISTDVDTTSSLSLGSGCLSKRENVKSLSAIEQIYGLVSHEAYEKVLFESESQNLTLFTQTMNRSWIVSFDDAIVCLLNASTTENQVIDVRFINASILQYRIFSHPNNNRRVNVNSDLPSDLTKLRHSFNVDWFRVEEQVFDMLVAQLIDSTKSLLPVSMRFGTNDLVFGYLNC